MNDIVTLITELGFPIAAAIGLGMFVWKLINRIIDGMETKLDTVDDKVNTSLTAMEERGEGRPGHPRGSADSNPELARNGQGVVPAPPVDAQADPAAAAAKALHQGRDGQHSNAIHGHNAIPDAEAQAPGSTARRHGQEIHSRWAYMKEPLL